MKRSNSTLKMTSRNIKIHKFLSPTIQFPRSVSFLKIFPETNEAKKHKPLPNFRFEEYELGSENCEEEEEEEEEGTMCCLLRNFEVLFASLMMNKRTDD